MAHASILKTCGVVGIGGVLFAIAADVLSWFLAEGYSPISQSISALAVGNGSWLIDLGLWVLASACVAIGGGMLALGISARRWSIAAITTITIGVEVAVVAMVNEYAGDHNAGANVHTLAIFLLYLSFAAAALTSRPGLEELGSSAASYSRTAGWIWIVLAPIYYFWYPSGWAGAFERALALLMLVWLLAIAALLPRWRQADPSQLVAARRMKSRPCPESSPR